MTPFGELIATAERGLVYGNRGCLHDARGAIRRRHPTQRWIACQLAFRGRRRAPLLAPGRYTELFFLDEATALAAGHRPCAECRRSDYNRLTEIWSELHPADHGADAIDARLDAERRPAGARDGRRRLHEASYRGLPDGAVVVVDDSACLVLGARLLVWSPAGYRRALPRPTRGAATVLTPPSLVDLLRHERVPLVPLLHPSADVLLV